MTEIQIRAALDETSILALTMWAEGRGDWREGHSSVEERIAIGVVCRNRLARPSAFRAASATYRAVCLAPLQFSCWNPGTDPNHLALLALAERLVDRSPVDDLILRETVYLADGIIHGTILDRTLGATMYYAPKAMKPAGTVPTWAAGKTFLPIGDQLFCA